MKSRPPIATSPAESREPLSRQRIAAAALRLIDDEGLDALSMRKLGRLLGVEAMALYHHFASKGEVMDAVQELLGDELELLPSGLPPLQRLRHAIRSFRQIALRHPNAFLLLTDRSFTTERSVRMVEEWLDAFRELGLDARQSARYMRVLGYLATGAGLAHISHIAALQSEPRPLLFDNFEDRFPLSAEAAPHLFATELDPNFEFGLEIIFEAMERDVAAAERGR